jgi:hypothetical protein
MKFYAGLSRAMSELTTQKHSAYNQLGPTALVSSGQSEEDAYAWQQGGVLDDSGVWMFDSEAPFIRENMLVKVD